MGEDNQIIMITMICKKLYDKVMHKVLWTYRSDTVNYNNESKSQIIEVKSAQIKYKYNLLKL